ncbi:MAG: flagellar hook-associated protein 3 [Eubacterium sp.]|nr:flagellar hook-associated protein 3 [Eubacterium sp.]
MAMRITNNMIMKNSIKNINTTKTNVDKLNNQMTSQKKIDRASEDPVIAIRSLRLRNTQAQVDQYLNNNISDASTWLEATEEALNNMETTLSSALTELDSITGTLNLSDMQVKLQNLQALRDELYSEGNADLNGRSLFTGYKTDGTLTFLEEDSEASYTITEPLSYSNIEEKAYYADLVDVDDTITVPTDTDGNISVDGDTVVTDPQEVDNYRIRLSYANLTSGSATGFSITYDYARANDSYVSSAVYDTNTKTYQVTTTDSSGNTTTENYVYDDTTGTYVNENDATLTYDSTAGKIYKTDTTTYTITEIDYSTWEAADFAVPTADDATNNALTSDNTIYFVPETGELVLGSGVAANLKSLQADISLTYDKTGFEAGEIRPENYFDCTQYTASNPYPNGIEYTKEDQEIKYTVASNTTLTVNVQASDVFNADAGRDIDELINAMQAAIDAETKVANIEAMMEESQYSGEDAQAYLSNLLAAAQKEADYTQDNVTTLYSQYLTKFQNYEKDVTTALSDVGNKGSQLSLIKTRMTNQESTLESLISDNEDLDLSEIVINYTAAYNAYESALLAASKASDNTLLDYI